MRNRYKRCYSPQFVVYPNTNLWMKCHTLNASSNLIFSYEFVSVLSVLFYWSTCLVLWLNLLFIMSSFFLPPSLPSFLIFLFLFLLLSLPHPCSFLFHYHLPKLIVCAKYSPFCIYYVIKFLTVLPGHCYNGKHVTSLANSYSPILLTNKTPNFVLTPMFPV